MKAEKKLTRRDSGIALLTTLLLMMLMSSLLVGFILLITSGQKLSGANNDYSRAFYASEAGMEKITADLGTLFDTNYSPSAAQINAIAAAPPAIPGIQYVQYGPSCGPSPSCSRTAGASWPTSSPVIPAGCGRSTARSDGPRRVS